LDKDSYRDNRNNNIHIDMGEYLQFNTLLDMMVEIEEVIQKILSKKEV